MSSAMMEIISPLTVAVQIASLSLGKLFAEMESLKRRSSVMTEITFLLMGVVLIASLRCHRLFVETDSLNRLRNVTTTTDFPTMGAMCSVKWKMAGHAHKMD